MRYDAPHSSSNHHSSSRAFTKSALRTIHHQITTYHDTIKICIIWYTDISDHHSFSCTIQNRYHTLYISSNHHIYRSGIMHYTSRIIIITHHHAPSKLLSCTIQPRNQHSSSHTIQNRYHVLYSHQIITPSHCVAINTPHNSSHSIQNFCHAIYSLHITTHHQTLHRH